jgi:hypothetical protein
VNLYKSAVFCLPALSFGAFTRAALAVLLVLLTFFESLFALNLAPYVGYKVSAVYKEALDSACD